MHTCSNDRHNTIDRNTKKPLARHGKSATAVRNVIESLLDWLPLIV
jgi:hypothetical protein